MKSSAQVELVIQAIACRVGGCLDWDPRQADRVRVDPFLDGLTPEGILDDLVEYVAGGGKVIAVNEKRPEWNHRTYYYKCVIPYPDLFRKGLFVEMELIDDDPELPVVLVVNTHEQK